MRTKYEFELWHRGQTRIGEIVKLMHGIHYKITRNGVYQLDFNMETERFHDYCRRINEHPNSVLENLITDIKVKRKSAAFPDGKYLFGAVVIEDPPNFNQDNSTMQVFCDGYLNLLADRYVTPPTPYLGVESTDIAWDLIDLTQSQTNGDLGITLGPNQYDTGVLRDRTDYVDQNVKDGVVNLTELQDGNFDLEIDALRRWNTYEHIGNDRPDVVINYPAIEREGIGARSMSMVRTGATVYNRILAYGSGFGEEAKRYIATDPDIPPDTPLRERKMIWSDISDLNRLAEHAEGQLMKQKNMLILPQFHVDGAQFDLNDIWIGDRVRVRQTKWPKYYMDGMFRIEDIEVWLDENLAETIAVTVDDFGL